MRPNDARHTINLVCDFASAVNAHTVFWNAVYAPPAVANEKLIHEELGSLRIHAQVTHSELLLPPQDVLESHQYLFDEFHDYMDFWLAALRHSEPALPQNVQHLSFQCGISSQDIITALCDRNWCRAREGAWGTHFSRQPTSCPLHEYFYSVSTLGLLENLPRTPIRFPGGSAVVGCEAAKCTLSIFLNLNLFYLLVRLRHSGMHLHCYNT